MNLLKRKFIKFICISLTYSIFPAQFLVAEAKKIFNPNLSDEQKNIMFNEGTERPFSSKLLKEKRKGFYHCANCGNYLRQMQNLIVELVGPLFLSHFLEHLRLKWITVLG